MEHFVLGALNLHIVSRIGELCRLPAYQLDFVTRSQHKGREWAAWLTDEGPVTVVAEYDHGQSQRVKAHVLYLEWSIEPGRVRGRYWWYCYPKRPREWIAGRGRL